MTPMQTEELGRRVAELCVRLPGHAGSATLSREMAVLAPGLAFREVLSRGGWYRLGGVVDGGGNRVADDLAAWAQQAYEDHDEDIGAMWDAYADAGLHATRLNGRTRYLVAATGSSATDFLQVEIEEMQEVVAHPLFDAAAPPGSLEDVVDPRATAQASRPLGPSALSLRRATAMQPFLARIREQKSAAQPVHRFVEDWERSSAGAATQFSNHWVIAIREHLDRYRQAQFDAVPVAALNGCAPAFGAGFGERGLALQSALTRYDKAAGYPMAWFFHMLTIRGVPHALAGAVIDDLQAGFRYLPDRDAAVVKDWLYRPYGF